MTLLLMRIGLAHIEAVYQGQRDAQVMIARAQARFKAVAHLN